MPQVHREDFQIWRKEGTTIPYEKSYGSWAQAWIQDPGWRDPQSQPCRSCCNQGWWWGAHQGGARSVKRKENEPPVGVSQAGQHKRLNRNEVLRHSLSRGAQQGRLDEGAEEWVQGRSQGVILRGSCRCSQDKMAAQHRSRTASLGLPCQPGLPLLTSYSPCTSTCQAFPLPIFYRSVCPCF